MALDLKIVQVTDQSRPIIILITEETLQGTPTKHLWTIAVIVASKYFFMPQQANN